MEVISFRDNVGARHGEVLRSSAIFYVRETDATHSTISFMNYWKLKRGLEVAVYASTRNMRGELLSRERLSFDKGEVINYRAPEREPFEGSIEIEVFSTQNMFIPYAAIVCHYETPLGYSVVHSYARTYSQHEIEEGRTLSSGREACWTVRDSNLQRSFAVVHNGSIKMAPQSVRLKIRNCRNEDRESIFDWPTLQAYETLVIRPQNYFSDLPDWLGGEPGQAKLDFELGGSFTRMLVGNERVDGSDMQVTHSNFDYGRRLTDMAEPSQCGFMHVPSCGDANMRVIVYPDSHVGSYQITSDDFKHEFRGGESVYAVAPKAQTLVFKRTDGPLPTRIVTALEVSDNRERLKGECSLGVLTELQPAKRLWWGSIAAPQVASSKLVLHDLPEVYGGIPADAELFFSLHSAIKSEPIKSSIKAFKVKNFSDGISIEDIWPDFKSHLGREAGYYTMFCSYGGLTIYTLMQNAHGSLCLEHGF